MRPRLILAVCAIGMVVTTWPDSGRAQRGAIMHDVSGLAWLTADSFVVVHDAKLPEEASRPRAGIFTAAGASVSYVPLTIRWPDDARPASDLESISRIPGSDYFLLAESGDDGSGHRRMYLCEVVRQDLHVRQVVPWPVPVHNVEGMAVSGVDDRLIFLYAERAHGQPETAIRWATMNLDPLSFGALQNVTFRADLTSGSNLRPVSALEVDGSGRIYAVSAYDPGREEGPFRSVVWEVGRLVAGRDGGTIELLRSPRRIATLDGFKVEALASRPGADGEIDLFVGTDDEGYGAAVRRLP